MRVPKIVVRNAQCNARQNMRDGFSASDCWQSAMLHMCWQYHQAKTKAVMYGFIQT